MNSDTNDVRARTAAAFRGLIEWSAGRLGQDLPEHVRRRAALVLADDIGAMVAATAEPQVLLAQNAFEQDSAGREATVFRHGAPRLDRYSAAAANGVAATWCELDEGFRAAPCHAGAYLLPALLAEAERRAATLGDVLNAVALAYEITARCALAFPFGSMRVHPHAAFATVGAAAGAGLIRGLDARALLGAVSGAASMSFAGPYNHAVEGALVRNAWTAAGAWIGLRSADWASFGIAGIDATGYDVFVSCLGAEAVPEALVDELGSRWAIAGGYHKVFACCQYAHSAVEASLELVNRLEGSGRAAADIAELAVETHPKGLTLTNVAPETGLAAKFSMPHAVAATALLGTGGARAFADDTLAEPRIAALRSRVRLLPHTAVGEWPKDRPARVTWRFRDGEEWTAACESARGGADQPFDDATLLAKLSENTRGVFPRMAKTLAAAVAGETSLRRPWPAVVQDMISGAV